MYTQCPECGVAFRVTADILRQAAGKVRCGGCGAAFNSLDHLSEEKPTAPVRKNPEFWPADPARDKPVELEPDEPPESISAAQSAALLKTLDELAGSDIRIEDTGVEWRVLNDDEDDAEPTGAVEIGEPELIADTGEMKFIVENEADSDAVDEFLEESPTPVDQFLTDTPPEIDSPEIFEEMRFDDNTPLPEEFDLDAPEPRPKPSTEESEKPAARVEEAQVDLELGDPDEWQDLLGEVETATAPDEPPDAAEHARDSRADEEPVDEFDAASPVPAAPDAESLPDIDTQFDIQAEAMGIDVSGRHAAQGADADELEPDFDDMVDESEQDHEVDPRFELLVDDDDDAEPPFELSEDEDEDVLVDEIDGVPVDEHSLTIVLEDEREPQVVFETREDPGDEAGKIEHRLPEMTEEEKTINMLIDQDLLSIAIEDDDGLTATIAQSQPDRSRDAHGDDDGSTAAGASGSRPRPQRQLFETIVMEGESFRGDDEAEEKTMANRRLGDVIRQSSDPEEEATPPRISRRGLVAAAVLLALLLVAQVIHQSRDALATVPVFHDTVGPLYRVLGKPLTPDWDITGWRFEATKGSTDEAGQVLTIYSRVGNRSDAALPYPLVHVSLTDRFEDTIGSRVLEPGEYLSAGVDPRELVPAGNTFNAVISIPSPSPEATGFQLNVCYRLAGSRLRCAIEDFK